MNDWIPTSSILPEPRLKVCILVKKLISAETKISIASRDATGQWRNEITGDPYQSWYEITHWMPMPEAPKCS